MLREAWGARVGLPATAWMLEVGAVVLRTETELILKSRRVVPGRSCSAGSRSASRLAAAARELVPAWRSERFRPSDPQDDRGGVVLARTGDRRLHRAEQRLDDRRGVQGARLGHDLDEPRVAELGAGRRHASGRPSVNRQTRSPGSSAISPPS